MTRLFGTDGVRGVANTDLTPELAFRLGEAAGHFLGEKGRGRIVVGRDTRRSGEMLEAALVAGITSGGADALVCGIVPTPAVALLTREMEADGGVVISASHNPPEYNGIKFFSRDGFKLPDDLEDEIEEFTHHKREWERPVGAEVGRIVAVPDAAARYLAAAVEEVGDLSGLRVAVDCGHGASAVVAREAFTQLGADVSVINDDWNGMDINVGCGSTDLTPLRDLMASGDYDLGIAHDGDADRVLAVDELGQEVDGDQIMAVLAVDMAERGELTNNTVVGTVMSNMGLEVAFRECGITFIKTKVGDRYVLEQMQSSGAVLGGEQSGHIILMRRNTTGDGLATALRIASVMKRAGAPLSKLTAVMTRYPQFMVNVRVRDKALLTTSAAVSNAIKSAEEALGETGRILVRASGTEPLVRVMAEAAEEAQAQAVVATLVEIVERELS